MTLMRRAGASVRVHFTEMIHEPPKRHALALVGGPGVSDLIDQPVDGVGGKSGQKIQDGF